MKTSDILAPWELHEEAAPEVVFVEPFKWRERQGQFALLRTPEDETRLVVRFERDDGSWIVAGKESPFSFLRLYRPSSPQVQDAVLQALKQQRLCRAFPRLGDFVVASSGLGAWAGKNPIRFSLGRRISKMKSSQTRLWIEGLLSSSKSDVSFAGEFRRGDHWQRWQPAFGFGTEAEFHGALEETQWLCVRILRSELNLWPAMEAIRWRLMPWCATRPFCLRLYNEDGRALELTPRLSLWTEILKDYGPLHPNDTRLCLRDWLETSPALPFDPSLEVPTFHEQLEARLELRAWAQSHLPPEVRNELERLDS